MWDNSLSNDFEKIEMTRSDHSKISLKFEHVEWFVFAHYIDFLGQTVYKFLGEFEFSLKESDDFVQTSVRKNTRVYLS